MAIELLRCGCVVLSLYCGWSDLRVRRIPNIAIALFLLLAVAQSLITGLWLDWWVAALALVVGFGVFLLGCFGAGDVKYFWACMLLVPEQVRTLLIATAFSGLGVAVFYLVKHKFRFEEVGSLPYGVAISIGLLLCLSDAMI